MWQVSLVVELCVYNLVGFFFQLFLIVIKWTLPTGRTCQTIGIINTFFFQFVSNGHLLFQFQFSVCLL
jgi:hypothetical protein